jgi:hypothetical protein
VRTAQVSTLRDILLPNLRSSSTRTANHPPTPTPAHTPKGIAAHTGTSPRPLEKRNATAPVHVTRSVGFTADTVKPTSTVPARFFFLSSFSFGFQNTNQTPSTSSTTAVTPWEMGTSTGWCSRIVAKPKKAIPA